jgi:RNA-directed DNA polymerase
VSAQRPPYRQLTLAYSSEGRGEAPASDAREAEARTVELKPESPADTRQMMEVICGLGNIEKALTRVQANKGSPGVDGMTVQRLPGYLVEHWPAIREQLLEGTYKPQPVKRVEIPKPDGGVRKLGIPTVVDRLIQQAVMQVLQGQWDRTFSPHSYGFRPGRSQHQAVEAAQQHVAAGYRWVVDLDLEKFFDRVNHDRLMAAIAARVEDKRLLRLIRAFLNAGVMENGLVSPTEEGTPQGGPLSPLLSNLVLDELDRELEKRGHRFVRYADDCNIYVGSERAGRRVMESVTRFISRRLKLKVNQAKSAVAKPSQRKFLGFSISDQTPPKRHIAPKAVARFKRKVREMTRRMRGVSVRQVVRNLAKFLPGWANYFGHTQWPTELRDLDGWIRRRLRSYVWRQWQTPKRRVAELVRLGVGRSQAWGTVKCQFGPWRAALSQALSKAMPEAYWSALGLPRLSRA